MSRICCENIVNVILIKYLKKNTQKNSLQFPEVELANFTNSYLSPSLTLLFYLLTLTDVKSCVKFLCIDFVKN